MQEEIDIKKFTSISPQFARATFKFTDNPQFAYLCSFIIENSKSLITNAHEDFLFNNFNRNSDIVTLLNAIYEISEYCEIFGSNTGLSNSIIASIYSNISNIFDSCDGRKAVIGAVKWSRNQPGGTLGMTNKFVGLLLEQKEFREKRRYSFVHALNANFNNHPRIIFKSIDDANSTISIDHRPGWHGLEIPGNIIILNDDYLIHQDPTNQTENPGIIGFEHNNPSINSVFFLSLLESYLLGEDLENDFIKIYRSPNPDKETAFPFHISNDNDQSILNFCPRTKDIESSFTQTVSMLLNLMPFLPYSILFNVESLGSAIEVKSYGQSIHYIEKVLPYSDPDENLPFAYRLCKETLKFAAHNFDEMKNADSMIRFAITGECLYYSQGQGNDVKNTFTKPDVAMKSNFVFDQNHPSHLVLLVDQRFSDHPQTDPLLWHNNNNNNNGSEQEQNEIERSNLFYVPSTKEEELLLLNQLVKDKENDSTCNSRCSPPKEYLSQPLFIYQMYSKVKALSICKNCLIVDFQSYSELRSMIDSNTHQINQEQISKMYHQLSGISFGIYKDSTAPLGQIIWALMNDKELFDNYIRSYFTIYVEYAIRHSRNYFTFCPNHPNSIFRIPKSPSNLCCHSCNMNYCFSCKKWHQCEESCNANHVEKDIIYCPRCLKPMRKVDGSDILVCNCGAVFCVRCGDKSPIFCSPYDAYEHINNYHTKKDA